MPNLNKVFLMGHITKDVETTFTAGGMAIAKFTLAVNDYHKDKDATVSFIDITAFGKQAEVLGNVKKGDPLFVEGRLQQDRWQDKTTGANRSKLGVILTSFQFLKARDNSTQDYNENSNSGDGIPF